MPSGTYGPEIWTREPLITAGQPSAPTADTQAPDPPRQLAWVGAHGGAGTTTLATVLGGLDAGCTWPRPDHGEPDGVLLVARTHAAGLQAASRALDVFRRGDQPPGLELIAVVLVADAPGRLPRQLHQRIKVIGSVTDVHRLPWVPSWRTGDLGAPPPRETAALSRLLATPPRRTATRSTR